MARPSTYTPEAATAICQHLELGESLRKTCELLNIPQRTVFDWLEANEDFRSKCARARDRQADALLDKQLELSQRVVDGDVDPQAAKVAISAYQWIGSKLAPKRYGDRLELAGDKANPIAVDSTLTVRFVDAKEGE